MTPLFSIIVPVYNVEKYIRECIESILNQTKTEFELILIDDGSTDNCPKICDEYAKMDYRITVIHNKNEGVSFARANGVSISTGKYLIFCDGDDCICDTMLEKISDIISNYEVDVVSYKITDLPNNFATMKKGKFYSRNLIEKEIFPFLLESAEGKYYPTSLCSAAFKRELYIKNQVEGFKIVVGEDLACRKAIMFNCSSLYAMNDVLYFYRPNNSSVTRSKKAFPWDGPELIGKHIESKIDLNNYGMEEQLYRVITHQLFLVVKSQFNRKDKYSIIKDEIKNNLCNSYYKKAINNCDYSFKYLKGHVAKLLLKYELIFLIRLFNKLGL